MVKTRKGVKRFPPKSSKEEPPDTENKKAKVGPETKSKYFNAGTDSVSDLNKNIDLAGIELADSDDSNDSLFVNKSKKVLKIEEGSDSDGSSSDEFMKAPISLDDLGGFETVKNCKMSKNDSEMALSSTVCRLSDDSEDDKEINNQEFYDFSQIIKSQELITRTKKEQEEKCKQEEQCLPPNKSKHKTNKTTKKVKKNNKPNLQLLGEELGISELLAMAEGPGVVAQDDSDDSECGVYNEKIKTEDSYTVPKEGVQVTIEVPNMNQVRKKKGVDVEAALKRRINLIRKENQVFMHKIHILCWIAHGIYLNRSVNNENLMGLALSLIPSNHCYPKKNMDLRYLEKLVEWFVGKVVVKDQKPALNSSNLCLTDVLESQIISKTAASIRDLVLIFVCMLRSLGISVRLVINLRPVPIRPPITDLCSLSNKPKEENSNNVKKSLSPSKSSSQSNGPIDNTSPKKRRTTREFKKEKSLVKKDPEIKSPYFSSSDDLPLTELVRKEKFGERSTGSSPFKSVHEVPNGRGNSKSKRPRKPTSTQITKSTYFSSENQQEPAVEKKQKRVRKSVPLSLQEHSSSSEDEIFQKVTEVQKNPKEISQKSNSKSSKNIGKRKSKVENNNSELDPPKPSTSKLKDRRVLSTDDDDEDAGLNKIGNDHWPEVFVEEEEKWISVDLQRGKVHCINQLYKKATQPVRYVLAWNNDGSIKDVTRRYAPQWLTVTRRQRVDDDWWSETMAPYTPPRTAREREEDYDLDRQIHDQPMPTSIADFKNHPLFAMKRHLLKFQAIYPPDAPPLVFVKSEPVYSRGCVVELHTREAWMKEAKLVRRDEEPYKIVKARPKYDKLSGARLNDLPLPLFGYWQVEDYIPPPAVDGKVPRNEYGNVELYKPCMLPPGTVHLQVPGLARVARKLDIDCVPAVVGWEFSGGGSHPVLDGFVVCEEFRDVLLDAWNKEIDESAKRAREKTEQRVYGNWKRLIKGLLIRERLKARYGFGDTENVPEKKKKKHQPKPGTSKS